MSPLSNKIQIEEIIVVEITYIKQIQYIIHACIAEEFYNNKN